MNAEVKQRPVITLQPVKSSQISAIGHCPATNTLAIEFKSWNKDKPSNVYHYDNFTVEQFADFQKSESFGTHFGKHIKLQTEKHPYTKIT